MPDCRGLQSSGQLAVGFLYLLVFLLIRFTSFLSINIHRIPAILVICYMLSYSASYMRLTQYYSVDFGCSVTITII
ncbi:hypothetical protein V1506DRAFT_544447, partial [Lipomyces tetrasporus]